MTANHRSPVQSRRHTLRNVILIYPDTHNTDVNLLPPLSLLYIATPLKDEFDITIIDQRVDKSWPETLKVALKSGHVLCVGISSMTGPQISGAIRAAEMVKEMHPSVPLIWGGVHPSLLPDQTIQNEFVDIVVVGDGEETFRELVLALFNNQDKKNVKGILFKDGEAIVRTPARGQFPIRSMPTLAYDLIDLQRYKSTPAWTDKKSLPIITSRGCPFRCTYCYNTRFCQKEWTALSAGQTFEAIHGLVTKYDISGVFLLDDNFFVDLHRVRDIARLIIRNGLDISIYNANCRVDSIIAMDADLLNLLKCAGFDQIFIGVESGSQSVLDKIKKDITVEQVLEANLKLRRAGIRPFFSFMAGFPFETIDDVKLTLALMRLLLKENSEAIIYCLQLFTPFPGTALYDLMCTMDVHLPASLEEWQTFSYDKFNLDIFDRKHRRFIEDLQFYSTFMDKKLSRDRSLPLRTIASILSGILDFRVSHGFYQFLYEISLLRLGQSLRNLH